MHRANEPHKSKKSFPGPEDKVGFLKTRLLTSPACRFIETHMSWVFLTEQDVFKLKKPIRLDHLDFLDLSKRKHFCREEVRLNQRLAKETDYAVIPLVLRHDQLSLGGSGPVIDWLVHMKRLPHSAQLSTQIEHQQVDSKLWPRALLKVFDFYTSSPSEPTSGKGHVRKLRSNLHKTLNELQVFRFDEDKIEWAGSYLLYFLENRRFLLQDRAEKGFIKECHGDLRPEHIFLLEQPQIIDALEFNHSLRTMDQAEEVSFLALELTRLGQHHLSDQLFKLYLAHTRDHQINEIKGFYMSHQALLRAQLALWHLKDLAPGDSGEKWFHKADQYLTFAAELAAPGSHPSLNP